MKSTLSNSLVDINQIGGIKRVKEYLYLQEEKDIYELAREMEVDVGTLKAKIADLHEFNPMLGHRGCRLAITYPEIYDMQVTAIIEAPI